MHNFAAFCCCEQVQRNNATLPVTALAIAAGQEGLKPTLLNVTVVNPRNLSLATEPAHWPIRLWVDWNYNASAVAPAFNLSAPAAVLASAGAGFVFPTQSYQYVVPGPRVIAVMIQTESGLLAEKQVTTQVAVAPIQATAKVVSLGNVGKAATQVQVTVTSIPGQDATDWPLTLSVDWNYNGVTASYSGYSTSVTVPETTLNGYWNYSTSGAKSVRVRVQDADGAAVEQTLNFTVSKLAPTPYYSTACVRD